MPAITLRLFGFGPKASGYDTETRSIPEGATIRGVWESLRSSANEDELLARIDQRSVFFLVNGRLIHGAETGRTVLQEGDTVTFMVLAIGG